MPDLRTLLHDAAHATPVTPAAAAVDADLARGRRALALARRSRRVRWTVLPAVPAAAAAGLLVVVGGHVTATDRSSPAGHPSVTTSRGNPSTAPSPGRATGRTGGTSNADLTRISLVAYTGAQPAGYTIDRVPDGWAVQGIDRYSLVIAPVGAKDTDPTSFVGKIVVGRANQDEIAVERPGGVRLVPVGRVTARLFTFPDVDPSGQPRPAHGDDATQGLLLPVGQGAYLIFQLPGVLHWDAATVAQFAAGVHMTPGARAAAG